MTTTTTIITTTTTTTTNKKNHNRNNSGSVLVTNHVNFLKKICIVTLLVPLHSTEILVCVCILKTARLIERVYWEKNMDFIFLCKIGLNHFSL